MTLFARLFCILALVAFAAGAVAHSAGSAAMASAMVTADAGMSAMGDCDACGDAEAGLKGAVCDFVCNAAGLASIPVPSAALVLLAASDAHASLPRQNARGIAVFPDKQPPRTYL